MSTNYSPVRPGNPFSWWAASLVTVLLALSGSLALSAGGEKPVEREYVTAPDAPQSQTSAQMEAKSAGCVSCHTQTDEKTMHANPAVKLGCTDCHGGNADVHRAQGAGPDDSGYRADMELAHVLPRFPETWHYPSSANPKRSYTLLNKESPEFVRFVNPSDYRIAREACGACHLPIIEAAERSLMATSAMLWGGAAYNNGILPYKRYIMGEGYTREGEPAMIPGPVEPTAEMTMQSILPALYPLPAWETIKPGDIFRVFERGGRNITNLFPETGLPNALGQLQRLEEPGRPDIRQSNRGPGTGARISVPVINITKTRLNDPHTWFSGTNDQPGDYRQSGCASCHVVYANDRDPRHSGQYAAFGHTGKTQTVDPTITQGESGHPLKHEFTRAIPTSQCMVCHMHQPNMFVNSYLGYTMWDYESDAPSMWPEKQVYPTHEEQRAVLERNPEGASPRGKWADVEFVKQVSEMNPELTDTQFADYHGHGWNFRAVFKRDRKGNLLDAEGTVVEDDDPEKFDKAVHMSSIHLDAGMHCVDCHYAQDNHGNGHIYGEVAAAVEIDCKDCHGSAKGYPNLFTSGPAALEGGTDMGAIRNPDGRLRFEWMGNTLIQRSVLDPELEWEVSLVKDSVDPQHGEYNAKAARAKLMSTDTAKQDWGPEVASSDLAHSDDDMECYTCHTSWTTSCAGCHLPIEANNKTDRHHYEGGASRNYATYNPQVSRDQMFLLGRREAAKGGKIAPVRSTSALILSSTNANREKIYIQQPPISASGFSSQAFNPHFAHTVRKTETKECEDCHLSRQNDNNAIMAQLLMQGTGFVNFVGYYAWVGGEEHVTGVQVTEWEEPQAVLGSYLHRYAYPDYFAAHQDNDATLEHGYPHSSGPASCVQHRGEYLFAAEGDKGMRVYDIASIGNKGVSQRIIAAPFSPLGQDTRIPSTNATCVVLPTNQPIHPDRNEGELMREINLEQPFHPIYDYALITDAVEGLILTDVNTLSDGEPRNNILKRDLTWNENGVLTGARHMVLGGSFAYIIADAGLVVVDLDQPLAPELVTVVPLNQGHSIALQFRYLFVTDADGLKVVDITQPRAPVLDQANVIPLAQARRMHLARTYAYVAAGSDGLAIVDITRPAKMKLLQTFRDGLDDSHDVVVASTNASLFAYIADGASGLKVVQLTSPSSQPKFYGFSPEPSPELIARYATKSPALSLSRGLERDRGVDETGGQMAVFGRIGARPLSLDEMRKLYTDKDGKPWFVEN
ncbi:hypothetical protein CWI75_13445 [Kineobactrum sediminis]|uniref:Uncharacterized protein n=1 Tax=Kineobactrum sediminis TaxID=1905677 RepID=A0A2N5Y0E9_9GAMM|nr:hypothetical protein [Kineobactrum sediminis]PLW81874.1 hypothetical protein CWI75_13445 [Kineobactrum sediminis]